MGPGLARGHGQVVRATRIAGGLHAQLAGRVTGQEIAFHAAPVHHLAGLHTHTLVVERRTALATQHKRVFRDADVGRENRLAQRVEQKAALAVQRAAADGLHKAAQQARSQRRLEQHRAFGGGDLARIQARKGTLGGIAAQSRRVGHFVRVAHGGVPGVALHVVAPPRDGRHRHAVARAGVAAAEAPRVGTEKMRLLRRHPGAFAVGDEAAGLECCSLAGHGQFGRLLAGDGPGVEQVQVATGIRG